MKTDEFSIIKCTSFKSRLCGLMFQKKIKHCLFFPHCNSIHTFFMKVPILVIITDKNHYILFHQIVKPWHIIWPIKNGYYTYEFPHTFHPTIENNILKINLS